MEDDNEAVEPEGSTTPATAPIDRNGSLVSLPSLSQITTTQTTSPSVFSAGAGRHYSISSAASQTSAYSPYFHSNHTSPAFGPQLSHIHSIPTYGNFGLGSPALKPVDSDNRLRQIAEGATQQLSAGADRQQVRSEGGRSDRSEQELDQEAAAALSMLNNDRRSWRPGAVSAPEHVGGNGAMDHSRGVTSAAAPPGTGMSVRDLLSG
jgi:hypothetical protein